MEMLPRLARVRDARSGDVAAEEGSEGRIRYVEGFLMLLLLPFPLSVFVASALRMARWPLRWGHCCGWRGEFDSDCVEREGLSGWGELRVTPMYKRGTYGFEVRCGMRAGMTLRLLRVWMECFALFFVVL